jgi:hypothetical protein
LGTVSPGTSVDADIRRRQSRRDRYAAQRTLWRVTKKKRLAYCGRVLSGTDAEVRVTGEAGTPEARAGFSGVQSCGSVWSCPVCSEKINAERQAELEAAITRWIDAGHAVVFGTFTMRHHQGQQLAQLWDELGRGWRAMTSGSAGWKGGKRTTGDVQRFGIAGVVRLVETKYGAHGWHPHVHALLFVENDLTDNDLEQLRANMFGRWSARLGKDGYSTLEFDQKGHAVGADLRRVKDAEYLADYFVKNGYRPKNTTAAKGAAYEVTGSQSKQAGKGGITPFQVLAELVADDHAIDLDTGEILTPTAEPALPRSQAIALWHEWESASAGKLQLTWSRFKRPTDDGPKSIRERLGLGVLKTDEEVVEECDLGGITMSVIGGHAWKAGRWAYRRHLLLEWAEAGTLGVKLAEWEAATGVRATRDRARSPV